MPKLTRQQQEEAVLALANKPNNSPHVRNYKPPADKKELIASIPAVCNDMRKHGEYIAKTRGRPPRFDSVEELEAELEALWEFSIQACITPNINSIASWLGVDYETVRAWGSDPNSIFSATIKRARTHANNIRLQMGEIGGTNPIFSMFILKSTENYVETTNVNLNATANIPAQTNPEQVAAEAERQVQRMLSDGTLRV